MESGKFKNRLLLKHPGALPTEQLFSQLFFPFWLSFKRILASITDLPVNKAASWVWRNLFLVSLKDPGKYCCRVGSLSFWAESQFFISFCVIAKYVWLCSVMVASACKLFMRLATAHAIPLGRLSLQLHANWTYSRWSPNACKISYDYLILIIFTHKLVNVLWCIIYDKKWWNCFFIGCRFSSLPINCYKGWEMCHFPCQWRPLWMCLAST